MGFVCFIKSDFGWDDYVSFLGVELRLVLSLERECGSSCDRGLWVGGFCGVELRVDILLIRVCVRFCEGF